MTETETETETEETEETDEDATLDLDGALAALKKVRTENATRRTKAKETEAALEAAQGRLDAAAKRLLALEITEATKGVLADPDDLLAHVATKDLLGDDGDPDPAKIKEAAVDLAARKPHLSPRTPAGDIDQGARGKPTETFDFSTLLRERAG